MRRHGRRGRGRLRRRGRIGGHRRPGRFGLASTPFNTAVGGTQFQAAQGAPYWSTTTAGYATSALGYIPEQAWNESTLGFGIMAGGGGASAVYTTPAWQSAYGVPATPTRGSCRTSRSSPAPTPRR